MKIKIFKTAAISILILLITIITSYFLQTYLVKRSLENKWLTAKETEFKGYEVVRCNLSILQPEVAFVDDYILLDVIKGLEIHFYTQENIFDFSRNSWSDKNYTGSTDVKNIAFPELLAMVKKDCSQFQEGYGDYYGDKLTWSYTEPRPEKTPEDLEAERLAEEAAERVYEYKVSTGQIEPEPSYDSMEEALRAGGFLEEEAIRNTVEDAGYDYVGPQ